MIVTMGGLHIKLTLLNCLADLLQKSGWLAALSEHRLPYLEWLKLSSSQSHLKKRCFKPIQLQHAPCASLGMKHMNIMQVLNHSVQSCPLKCDASRKIFPIFHFSIAFTLIWSCTLGCWNPPYRHGCPREHASGRNSSGYHWMNALNQTMLRAGQTEQQWKLPSWCHLLKLLSFAVSSDDICWSFNRATPHWLPDDISLIMQIWKHDGPVSH